MTLKSFIQQNREELDRCIRRALRRPDFPLNDKDRRDWIANDEGLYSWARQAGVRF